jgi:uncharacterized protein YjbJ (UPF0337 family)
MLDPVYLWRKIVMDKHRISGTGKEVKGKAKETFGQVTGDRRTEDEGKADKTAGKAEKAYGNAMDAVREVVEDK